MVGRADGDHVEALVAEALRDLAPGVDRRNAEQLLGSAIGLLGDDPDPLDLKIAAAAMTEMREAFAVFAPYRDVPKVTVFGSARTAPDDPVYAQADRIARDLASMGWMVVTGAGPGIMQAAMEGAGREHSIGVAIRLPFEQGANPVIAGDDKYVAMRYFFTRKLMLVKESKAFICLPGGFGTLDESFELLTWNQLGLLAAPVVFLDVAGFFGSLFEFITHSVESGFIRPEHAALARRAATAADAVDLATAPPLAYLPKWVDRPTN